MKRRNLLGGLSAAALASACTPEASAPGVATNTQTFSWKMVTTWPPNFPGLGIGANNLAKLIEQMSGGRLKIAVYAGGELVPPFEVFDTVSRGSAEMGHGAAYYWKGKAEATQFFTAVPFGLNAQEIYAWLYYGGGLALYREVYADFNLMPFPAGNTGVQMGGWFNKRIDAVDDLKGLKMRIPGLGGEILKRAGGTPVTLPGSEIFTALQTGSVDAAEWVGPYNDVAFGMHQAAQYYYYPGWHEPGPALECLVNAEAWASLPEDLQAIVSTACQALCTDMLAEFAARNATSLRQLLDDDDIEVLPFPDEVLKHLKAATKEVLDELTARDPMAAKIWASQSEFARVSDPWQQISEAAFLRTRSL
jgi:TRAP-type mannitol/chloroaromatic compound transport system substrate-binding protein